jgi:hypothetical protein
VLLRSIDSWVPETGELEVVEVRFDVVWASNPARFLIFSALIVLAATIVIIATRGQLGRAKAATAAGSG